MFGKNTKVVRHIVFVRNIVIILVNNSYLKQAKNKYNDYIILSEGTSYDKNISKHYLKAWMTLHFNYDISHLRVNRRNLSKLEVKKNITENVLVLGSTGAYFDHSTAS